ncbi:hypothetical protein OROGR_029040 [Orobanche gracilis]
MSLCQNSVILFSLYQCLLMLFHTISYFRQNQDIVPTKDEFPVSYYSSKDLESELTPNETNISKLELNGIYLKPFFWLLMMKNLYQQSLRHSTSGLEHYNKKHVNMWILSLLNLWLVVLSFVVMGYGSTATEKPRILGFSGEKSDGSSIKLFFSELKVVRPANLKEGIPERYKVTACRIIDEVLNKSQVVIPAVIELFIPLAGSERDFTTVIGSVFLLCVPSQAKELEFELHVLL